jgi:hypothetical protein
MQRIDGPRKTYRSTVCRTTTLVSYRSEVQEGRADSRVPLELTFRGHGIGELFVPGALATATLGTVEYGAAVLGSSLIVVLAQLPAVAR